MNKKHTANSSAFTSLWIACAALSTGCQGLAGNAYRYDLDIVGHVVEDTSFKPVDGRQFKFCLDYQSDRADDTTAAGAKRTTCAPELVTVANGEFRTKVPVEFCSSCLLTAPAGYLDDGYADGGDIPGQQDIAKSTPLQKIGEKREGTLHYAFTVETKKRPAVAAEFEAVKAIKHESTTFQDVDLLWVVDNSKSMGPYQTQVAKGLVSIAKNFFVGDRSLRMSVITTDTWAAGTGGVPACYGRLVPGYHDGPARPFAEVSDSNTCTLVNPLSAGHTGKPILSSRGANGKPIDPKVLAADFAINAQAGITGSGDERGLSSVDTFLRMNEERAICGTTGEGCLFRKNTLRGIIFLSDEHSSDDLQFDGEYIDHRWEPTQKMSKSEFENHAKSLADLMRRRLNSFFTKVDGSGAQGNPNYFVASIVRPNCVGECAGPWADMFGTGLPKWGPEYTALSNGVKNDATNQSGALSIIADIENTNFPALLQGIGESLNTTYEYVPITQFTVAQKILKISSANLVLADGTSISVPSEKMRVTGDTTFEIDPSAWPSPLPHSARLQVSYVPF